MLRSPADRFRPSTVTNCELRSAFIFANRVLIAWIDFLDLRGLINNLRFVIAHSVDLVRDLVEVRLSYEGREINSSPPSFTSSRSIFFSRPPLIGEWIK